MSRDAMDSRLASVLEGQYELERELGRGGMGIVYLAREVRLGRQVAIKVLPPELAGSEGLKERFLREAHTAAHLSHPNIVPVYRADEIDGYAFFVMGFVDGESLGERLRRLGALSPQETVRVLREAAWALAYAHARGVVHRDVKPENLMLDKGSSRVVVTDFGIARDLRASRLTLDGYVLGTVHYMSPEQLAGDALDGRSDLYALGVIGFECLSGRLPFDAGKASAVIVQHATEPAPPLRSVAADVPPALAAVIDRCLLKDPADRYPTGEALAEALTAALNADASLGHPVAERVISEEEARAIWRRAAELQAEAATRLRQRYQLPQQASSSGGSSDPTSGYRLGDVERAAVEAGIASEFVTLALAEGPSAGPLDAVEPSSREERVWRTMLGTSRRSLLVARRFAAPPRLVLEAIGQTVAQFPWEMTLRDTVGGHPLDGGILVFHVKRLRTGDAIGSRGISMFSYRLTQVEMLQLNVTLRAITAPTLGTEVNVSGDLRPGLRKNWVADRAIAALLTLAGGAVGGVLAAGPLALGPGLVAAPVIGGAAVLGGASLAWYRWLYRHALRKTVDEVEKLLDAIEAHLRARAVFGTAAAGAGLRPETGEPVWLPWVTPG